MSTPPDLTRGTEPRRASGGKALQFALVMLGACVVLSLVIGMLMPQRTLPSGTPSAQLNLAVTNKSETGVPNGSLKYHADPSGHFFVDATVNGATLRFLVDTGATHVVLTPEDARAAGIFLGGLSFSETMNTANGQARAAPATLRDVRLDQLAVDNVPAVVMEKPMPVSLLGMSFLQRLRGYSIRDGVLTIEW